MTFTSGQKKKIEGKKDLHNVLGEREQMRYSCRLLTLLLRLNFFLWWGEGKKKNENFKSLAAWPVPKARPRREEAPTALLIVLPE